jgi:integrase
MTVCDLPMHGGVERTMNRKPVIKLINRSGTWTIYAAFQGVRKAKAIGKDPVEAERELRKYQVEIDDNLFDINLFSLGHSSKHKLFKDVEDEWMQDHFWDEKCKGSTKVLYEKCFRLHITPEFGKDPIHLITKIRVKTFLKSKRDAGLSRKYVSILGNILHMVFDFGIKHDYISENPGINPSEIMPTQRRNLEKLKVWNENECGLFLSFARKYAPAPYFALFATGIFTGMRIGELRVLKPDDVDFKDRVINVQRAIYLDEIGLPKGYKTRKIDLHPQLMDILGEYISALPAYFSEFNLRPEWLFAQDSGNLLKYGKINYIFHKIIQLSGVNTISIHGMRHTFCSLLLQKGIDLCYIQRALGHATLQMLISTYGHYIKNDKYRGVDMLSIANLNQQQTGNQLVG